MPWGDRTGPMGYGPMTGRGAGLCTGYPTPGYMNPGFGGRFRNTAFTGVPQAVYPPMDAYYGPAPYYGANPFGFNHFYGFGRRAEFGRGRFGRGRGGGRRWW